MSYSVKTFTVTGGGDIAVDARDLHIATDLSDALAYARRHQRKNVQSNGALIYEVTRYGDVLGSLFICRDVKETVSPIEKIASDVVDEFDKSWLLISSMSPNMRQRARTELIDLIITAWLDVN